MKTVGDHGVKYIRGVEVKKGGRKTHLFLCSCGSEFEAMIFNVKAGKTKSCGCLARSILRERNLKHGMAYRNKKSRLYNIWNGIKVRCFNSNHHSFEGYGSRGITICSEWVESYEVFHEWAIGNGYNNSLCIDRIDNNGNYEPNNCRWVTYAVNNKNKRSRQDCKTGISGVSKRITKSGFSYRVRIKSDGEDTSVGTYADFFEACCARKSAENTYWR